MSGTEDRRTGFSAALIDLDGVLVDTATHHFAAWKRLAGELGFEFTQADNERLKGVSRRRSLEILLEIGGLNLPEGERAALADRKNQWYVERISNLNKSNLLPGAIDFLRSLRERGIKAALASASKNAPLILARLGIAGMFDAVVDGNRVGKAKPDPEIFLLAARELGVEPHRCFVVEDSEAGLQAAKTAGMLAVGIGVPTALTSADRVFGNLSELDLEWILRNTGRIPHVGS